MSFLQHPGACKHFRERYPELPQSHFDYITMGYDPDDFKGIAPVRPVEKDFIITFLGMFDHKNEPKGYYRTPLYTFEALRMIKDNHPELAEKIHFVIVGHLFETHKNDIERLDIKDMVTVTGFVPHKQSLAFAMGSDVLDFTLYSKGRGNRHLPAKLFEYLATGKPILALAPPSDATDIVERTNTGISAMPEEPEEICEAILKLFESHQLGESFNFNEEETIKYHQKNKTLELLSVFDRVLLKGKKHAE